MMKLTNIALASALLALVAVTGGCKNDDDSSNSDDGVSLGTDEAQLVEDDTESADTDDTMENGVDTPLSGADPSDPGNPASGASDEEVLDKVVSNAHKHFLGSCLDSTRDGNKIHHVFHACRAGWSLKTFEGTILSTYVRDGNKLTITHEFNGFLANGATLSGTRVVTYTREPATSTGDVVISKTRTGNFTGTTKKGKDISHTANFSASYDSGAKCITRDGTAETTIGNRTLERTLSNYKRCGIGALGCPDPGGTLVLHKTNDVKDKDLTLTIEFLGDTKMRITRPNGKQVDRTLLCNEDAS